MPFKGENAAAGVPAASKFRVGESDADIGAVVEQGINIPWSSDPSASWVYYDCTVGSVLDSGIVVHSHLPQVDNDADTLAHYALDDPAIDQVIAGGVNLRCRDQYADIVQRMGHARYWFRIWGQALRVGYQVPIPGIKTIGGVPAVPYDKNPQWAFNRIAPGGNYSGVILWHAEWSLWYTTAAPPVSNAFPAANPFAHIDGTAVPPQGIQAPFSKPDDNAASSVPATVGLK